ncbi:MAG: hypothetical protein D6754_02975 [Alphaproteobacteria bacterium]|nr:MAG: hypothetical protein D6754_02975 [Alphaproteobacteria bacterium]
MSDLQDVVFANAPAVSRRAVDVSVAKGAGRPMPANNPLADARGDVFFDLPEALQPLGFSNDGRQILASGTVALRADARG